MRFVPLGVSLLMAACAARPAPARHVVASRAIDAPADVDVADYTMDVRLAPTHRTIDGTARITWINRSAAPATELWWHLYMNAFEGPNTLFMRSGGLGGHRGHAPGDHGHIDIATMRLSSGEDLLAGSSADPSVADDRSQLRTPLPRAVAPGERITIDVAFHVTLPRSFARTGYAGDFTFAAQWFPKLAVLEHDGTWAHFPFHSNTEFYADFGRYDVSVSVPSGDVVGAVGIEDRDARATAQGVQHHFIAAHVHDFAFTAWSGFVEQWATVDGFEVRVLAPPGIGSVVTRTIESIRHAADMYRTLYGPYPYPQLTVVIPPRAAAGVGGMEYPTLITGDGEWFLPRAVHDVEWVTVHEFAHQYFYGLFASNEFASPFLDEGLAEYATGRVLTAWFGRDRELFDALGISFGYRAFEGGLAPTHNDNEAPTTSRSDEFRNYRVYGDRVYRRTAATLESAERIYGAAALDLALQRYASRARFHHPVAEDFFAALGSVDPSMRAFVERSLTTRPTFDDAIRAIDDRIANGAHTTTIALSHRGEFTAPRTVTVRFDDGSTQSARWDGVTPSIAFTSRTAARDARIDAAEALPIDADRLDDARRADSTSAPRDIDVTARLSFFVDALLRVLGP